MTAKRAILLNYNLKVPVVSRNFSVERLHRFLNDNFCKVENPVVTIVKRRKLSLLPSLNV